MTALSVAGAPAFEPLGAGSAPHGVIVGPDGSVLSQAETNQGPDKLIEEIHKATFSPRINLSQTDLDSLDGSNLTGTTQSTKVQEMFKPGKP